MDKYVAEKQSMSILFKNPRKYTPDSSNIIINGTNLQRIPEVKYLGLWIDEKINWNSHIAKISKKKK